MLAGANQGIFGRGRRRGRLLRFGRRYRRLRSNGPGGGRGFSGTGRLPALGSGDDFCEESPQVLATALLRDLVDAGYPAERAAQCKPPDLARGFGPGVLDCLRWLGDAALSAATLAPPDYGALETLPDEGGDGGEVDDDDIAEDIADAGDADVVADDAAYGAIAAEPSAFAEASWGAASGEPHGRGVLAARVDADVWALELERVGPALAARGKSAADASTWSGRLDVAKASLAKRETHAPAALDAAARVGAAARDAADRLGRGEATIARSFADAAEAYARDAGSLAALSERCAGLGTALAEKQAAFDDADASARASARSVEERGASLGDSTKLRDLRQALQDLRKEAADLARFAAFFCAFSFWFDARGPAQEVGIGIALQQNAQNWRQKNALAAKDDDDDGFEVDSLLTDSVS